MRKGINHRARYDAAWIKLMALGEMTGCHQRPDRSFFIRGYQLPVCARCTGVIFGYLLAIPGYLYFGFCYLPALFSCLILFMDWLLQALDIKASTNKRRLITGILGGLGLMSIQLELINRGLQHFRRKKKSK
jgi:uncharacterized membrane protein